MDPVDLDSLAWRAIELAVQRRHDPRLIVATRATIGGPASTARLVAGLCNAATGRRVIALFGLDDTDIVGLDDIPDETWLRTVTARFPGVVPTLAATTIEADGAHIVALTADDPGTLIVATRSGRVVIPWFDGTLADRPPTAVVDPRPARPAGRIEACSGWLERTLTCTPNPASPAAGIDATPDRSDGSGDADRSDIASGAGIGVVVWRGVLDIALALDTSTVAGDADADATAASSAAASAGNGPDGPPAARRRCIAIADRDVSATLLADGSAAALSLDVQVHATPGATAAIRSDRTVVLDPLVPCRLYLAAATPAPVFDPSDDLDGAVRLLVSLRVRGDDRLVATMATLASDATAASQRWTL